MTRRRSGAARRPLRSRNVVKATRRVHANATGAAIASSSIELASKTGGLAPKVFIAGGLEPLRVPGQTPENQYGDVPMNLINVRSSSLRSPVTSWSPLSEPEPHLRRLVLVTDAWKPQTNGVVNTLVRLVDYLESQGVEVLVIAPDSHRTLPLPSYPEIRVAYDPWRAIPRIQAFKPDAIHVATEGPLGFWTVGWLRRQGLRFTTSFHTRYAEYLSARVPVVPLEWGYQVVRWFHERAEHTLVSSKTLLEELTERRVARKLVHWPRGVDASLFHPDRKRRDVYQQLPRPIWLYVGRVALEKTLDDFLKLPLEGTKVMVGDGPSRAELEARYPDVVWRGYRY